MKFNQVGRSMVEMLGVLAIIGVLSVGAIAGYSKAMTKYKLNKQREQLTSIISGTKQLFNREVFTSNNVSGNMYFLKQLLMKLNIIPPEMIETATGDYGLYDVMKNSIVIYWAKGAYASSGGQTVDGFFTLTIDRSNSHIDKDSCVNILDMAKEMHSDLWRVSPSIGTGDGGSSALVSYYGNFECGTSDTKPCLRDLTVSEINRVCDEGTQASRFWINLMWL